MSARARLLAVFAAAFLTGSAAHPRAADGPDLQTVLDRATAYSLKFVEQFQNVVAEEVYVQEMSSPGASARSSPTSCSSSTRTSWR